MLDAKSKINLQTIGHFTVHLVVHMHKRIGLRLGWWEDFGSDGLELQQLAIRILSQAVSSSCLEQLWSSYSHTASKKRNRLGAERANGLVFINANL